MESGFYDPPTEPLGDPIEDEPCARCGRRSETLHDRTPVCGACESFYLGIEHDAQEEKG